jgi:hypothetical protein
MSHVDLHPLLSGRHARRSRAPQLPDFRYLASGVSVAAPGQEKSLAYLTIAASVIASKCLAFLIQASLFGFDRTSLATFAVPAIVLLVLAILGFRLRNQASAVYLASLGKELEDRGLTFEGREKALLAVANEQILLRQCQIGAFASLAVAFVSGFLLVATQSAALLCPQIASALTIGLIALIIAHMTGADQHRMEAVRFVRRALAEPKSAAARLT